jgi:hypothetical protein
MTNCTDIVELRNIGEYLYKARRKGENKVSKLQVGVEKRMVGFYEWLQE